MKLFLHKLSICCFILGILTSCKKDAQLTTLAEVAFPSAPTANTDAIILLPELAEEDVLNLHWPAVTYPIAAPVNYTIEFNTPANTGGSSAWTNSIRVEVGQDILTKTFKGNELNDIAQGLGLPPSEAGDVVFRVLAAMNRQVYSETLSLSVSPYALSSNYPALWVPGDYQGWDPATAPKILSLTADQLFEGYIYIPEGGSNQFKLTAQDAWEPMAYGDGGNGVLIEANFSGANFSVPSAGYYNLTVSLQHMTYNIMATTWSILGDASPGGWEIDTPLEYDAAAGVWEATADMSANGSFKFRANNAWILDFGIDADGKLAYANHPVLGYNADINNITVPSNGNYTIRLDLKDPANYHYTLSRNN